VRRILLVMSVGLVVAAVMVASALPAFAQGQSEGRGSIVERGETGAPELIITPARGSVLTSPGTQERCVTLFGGSAQGQGPSDRFIGPGCEEFEEV
jgi:hypothetical protein